MPGLSQTDWMQSEGEGIKFTVREGKKKREHNARLLIVPDIFNKPSVRFFPIPSWRGEWNHITNKIHTGKMFIFPAAMQAWRELEKWDRLFKSESIYLKNYIIVINHGII